MSDFLKSIYLNLSFGKDSEQVSLPLFAEQKGSQYEMEPLEAKAKKWQIIVSDLSPVQALKRALRKMAMVVLLICFISIIPAAFVKMQPHL